MSVQLTVYPQNFSGFVPSTVVSLNQLNENVYFTSLNSAVTTVTSQPWLAIDNTPASVNWERFAETGMTEPAPILNVILLEVYLEFYGGNGVVAFSGVYQKLPNLIIGQTYEILLDIKIPRPHNADLNNLYFGINGAGLVSPPQMLAGNNPPMQLINDTTVAGWTTPIQFTATQTDEIFALTYESSAAPADQISINEIIVRKASVSTVDDGQIICDLYNEDLIPLTLSVDTFKNAGEKQQSYSKAFKLPATKHNNKIFENIFELTRDTSSVPLFNPYKQTRAVYKEDGQTIFKGFLKLIDIQNKNGEISYNVNLYSESVALATLMKAEKMSDIDFSELNHLYNRTTISESWNGLLTVSNPLPVGTFAGTAGASTTNVLKYPNCNWNGQMLEQSTAGQQGNGATANMPSIDKLQVMFRPWLKVRYIIDRLFERHGFTYTSNFFSSAYFERLFMDFNWGKEINWTERLSIGSVDFSSGSPALAIPNPLSGGQTIIMKDNNTFTAAANYDETTGKFTANATGVGYDLECKARFTNNGTVAAGLQVYWLHTDAISSTTTLIDTIIFNIPAGGTHLFTTNITSAYPILINDTVEVAAASQFTGNGTTDLEIASTQISGSISGSALINGTLLNSKRGKLKQWDVFKGITDMFNLVTLQDPTKERNLIIEPYNDVFVNNANAQILDWTEKVDAQELKFKPMDLTQSTMFQYSEDKDYPFTVYKDAVNGYLYGSLEWTVPSYTQVKGQTKIEAKPFAATIVKPFFDSIPQFVGPCIYKGNADATQFEGMENKPRILYDVTGDIGSVRNPVGGGEAIGGGITYYIPYQNGVVGANYTNVCIFSHVDNQPSTSSDNDLNFGACQFIGIGVPPVKNLFSEYYSDYFYELYNPDTRTIMLRILLTGQDVSTFNFYDKVRIKNRVYRVSKINYKPNQLSDVELILIP
tara:strand:+ start:2249 stop:5050 length:2802 start_codon:yes stop_codon:yes gene_type:complete